MDKCIVCGNSHFTLIYKNTLQKCNNCSFITANISISDEDLKQFYGEKYFNGEEYSNYIDDKETIQKNFICRLKQIDKITKRQSFSQVLEIGCAYGFFGELIKNKFPSANYIGFDIAKEAVEYGKSVLKLNVLNKNYLESDVPSNLYSHVFMWDVIEHLPNPEKFIGKISKESVDGSYLFITTGDISSLIPRIKGSSWRMIHPPTHLHYFSKKTLRKLLEKYAYEIKTVKYPPVSRTLKQIFYSLFMLQKKERKWKLFIYNKIPSSFYIKINTYDIMFVVAKKRNA